MIDSDRPRAASADLRREPRLEPDPDAGRLAEAIEGVSRRSEPALRELFDAASPWVQATAMRILHDRQRAEEVTLDVFLRVWQRAESYDTRRGGVLAWLLTMARSRALDRLRRLEVQARAESAWGDAREAAGAGGGPAAGQRGDEPASREVLRSALAGLPETQRQAIELAFYPGLTHAEIAARLDEPLGTVKTRIRLGLQKLREALEPGMRRGGELTDEGAAT